MDKIGQNGQKLTEFDILDKIEQNGQKLTEYDDLKTDKIGQNSHNLTFLTKSLMIVVYHKYSKKAKEFQTLHRVHHGIAEKFDDIRPVRISD